MPNVRVKEGREYVFGGILYKSGETVPNVNEKFLNILTGPKGPLELGESVAAKKVEAKELVDLPGLKNTPPAPKVEEADESAANPKTLARAHAFEEDGDDEGESEGKSFSGRGEYQRRDLQATQTGLAKPLSSSRQAPAPKTPRSPSSRGKQK